MVGGHTLRMPNTLLAVLPMVLGPLAGAAPADPLPALVATWILDLDASDPVALLAEVAGASAWERALVDELPVTQTLRFEEGGRVLVIAASSSWLDRTTRVPLDGTPFAEAGLTGRSGTARAGVEGEAVVVEAAFTRGDERCTARQRRRVVVEPARGSTGAPAGGGGAEGVARMLVELEVRCGAGPTWRATRVFRRADGAARAQ